MQKAAMRMTKNLLSWIWIVTVRLVLCAIAGVCLGAMFWTVILLCEGKNLIEAARGQVEDAIGLLQGLAALGGLVGGAVGLVSGLGALAAAQTSQPLGSGDNG